MPLTTSTPFCSILLHSILLTRLRFAIQRCAARALTQPSFRQLSTLRQTTRVTTPFPAAQPSLLRTFHQSRLWLAPEGKTDEARATDETIPTEHEADVEPDTLTEKVKDYASSAAETLSNAAASTTAAASSIASAAVGRRVGEWPGDSGTGAGPKRIIYVGNLFFETTIEEVEAEFAQYGQISKSRLVADARGMSKGFAYVEFAEPEAAEQAVQRSDQKTLNGRRMAVQYHVRNEKRTRNVGVGGSSEARNPPSKTLFIGNMSYQMSDRDLNDLFRDIRSVLDVRVAIDRRSGQPRGFAHADFVDVASAVKAKEVLEGKSIYGRQLRIDYSARDSEPRDARRSDE